MRVLSVQNYIGIPIFQASKGNEYWFEKSGVTESTVFTEERESTFGSSYWEVRKIRFPLYLLTWIDFLVKIRNLLNKQ